MSHALPRKAFVDDEFMRITPALVRELGGNTAGASVLVTIEYRARMFGFEYDGYRWWTANRQEISHDTGLSVSQVDRQLTKLVEGEYVLREKFSARRSDHTYSYRIVYDDGGSMPSMYQARQQPPAALVEASEVAGTVGNTDVTDSGHEATPDVTDSRVHDVTDSRVRDVTDSRLLPSVKKEKKVKNTHTLDGSAAGARDGQVEALLESPVLATATAKVPSTEDEFEQWYAAYPRKMARGAALKAFKAARKKVSHEVLMTGLAGYLNRVRGSEARFIAYPASWLNAERWADEADAETQARVGAPATGGFFAASDDDRAATASMFDDPDPWMDAPQAVASAPDPYAF